ncbi:MAG: hypothetical protein GWN64_07885 [Candidatus Thorarchaeota archaeon]|nr:hypothetical protein [Candidatus Thorarchaeota archaeon]
MTTDKKTLILNCIRLGMDFYTSCLSVSCSKEEIENLENDEQFQKAVEINTALLEKDLLEDHDKVIADCVDKGIASPLQWKLERVNPSKWGSRQKLDLGDKGALGSLTINMVRGDDGS